MKKIIPFFLLNLCALLLSAPLASADSFVPMLPANIGPTTTGASGTVEVVGQPRVTQGHPCTVWDQEDIKHFREMLKTSKELQAQLAELKADMDKRIAEPLNIPPPKKGVFPGEYFPAYPGFEGDDAGARWRRRVMQNSREISDLATVYALTGDAKYGEYCKQMLLAYACFPQHGVTKSYTLRSASGIITQLLEEALYITRLARAYDLVYNIPSWTPQQRAQIHDDLFVPLVNCQLYPAGVDVNPKAGAFATQENNRGAIGTVSVLMAGYATDDSEMINASLYGIKPTQKTPPPGANTTFPPPKHWTACTDKNPSGYGLLANHFGKCILPDGVWIEGSPSYTFYVLGSMLIAAETLWHHGTDMYRYRNGVLKSLFDFPLLLAYPDMTLPALNDAHHGSIGGGNVPVMYEYAYRRYRDPAYLPMIKSQVKTYGELNSFVGAMTGAWGTVKPPEGGAPTDSLAEPKSFKSLHVSYIGDAPTSILYDLDSNEKEIPFVQNDVNFSSVGFGILRTPGPSGVNNVTFTYGPSASHGHPDKLEIDIFAFNDVLMPDPGVHFPYNNPLNPKWYHTTLAHGTLTVDEKSQIYQGELWTYPKGTPNPQADQLVYGPAATMGIQRAWTNTCYTGVTMDRSLFLTRNYLADIFSANASGSRKYDLAWHLRGELTSDLKLDPMAFQNPPNGYNVLTNVRHAAGDKPWFVALKRGSHVARLLGAACAGAEVIVGDGGTYDGAPKDDHVPTIIMRHDKASATTFGAVLDLSDSQQGYVKSVTQEGALATGYSLLTIVTTKGTDYCLASYRSGNIRVGSGAIETDAQQALVETEGKEVKNMYLGGGKNLKVGAVTLQRNDTGLAYLEKNENGGFILANPSPTPGNITVFMPNLDSYEVFLLDSKGKRAGAATLLKGAPNAFSVTMKAAAKVELAPKAAATK